MKNELIPVRCGCGGEAKVVKAPFMYEEYGDNQCYTVFCDRCGIDTRVYPSEAEAVEAWNKAMGADQFREATKKMEPERTVRIKCGGLQVWARCECGQSVHMGWEYCPFCGGRIVRK